MTTRTSSTTTVPAVPSLPTELVDEIFRSDQLSSRDLARCCLVSRQFLPSARHSLYDSVTIAIIWSSVSDWWTPTATSSKLISTLRRDPFLGRLCRCLHFERTGYSLPQMDSDDALLSVEQIAGWFKLMPNLRIFSSPTFVHPEFLPSSLCRPGGRPWHALDLNLSCSNVNFDHGTGNTTLKKLRAWDLQDDDTDEEIVFPSSVETLDVVWYSLMLSNDKVLRFSLGSHLKNLRISLNPSKLSHLAEFPNLRYFSIYNITEDNCNLESLVGLNRLLRLSLSHVEVEHTQVKIALISLLSNLPASISRLDFPNTIPFDPLTSFLRSNRRKYKSITQIGLSETENLWRWKSDLDPVKRLCEARGIEVYYVGKKDPIFDF